MATFKNLLRPEGAAPVGEPGESVESARGEDSARMSLAALSSALPDLVFEGYQDWYAYDDEWVLRNLGHVLTPEQESEILSLLGTDTPESLAELLDYLAGQRGGWQNAAREEFAGQAEGGSAAALTGTENTANWQASRTPGTYYYTYAGDRYLYSDTKEGPAGEWSPLPEREERAAANAQPWGGAGWFYTPADKPELYGGAYVYAAGREGPWMTEEQATARMQTSPSATTAATSPAPGRYTTVQQVSGHDGWAQGYDTQDQVWKYAPASGGGLPGDEAPWAAVNEFRAGGTEYFAGPGSSDSGWLPYQAESAEPPMLTAAPEDVEKIMRELLEENPELAEIEESERREIVTEAVLRALADEA